MKIQDYSFSSNFRKETDFMDFVAELRNILNLGRYQMRIVTTVPTYTGEGGEHLLYISGSVRRLYWYDDINSTWQYIEWNGAGLGSTAIVEAVEYTEQTASIGSTTLYTPPAVGLYRVSVYQLCTKAGAGGTLDTTLAWTDDSGVQGITPASQVDLTSLGSGGTSSTFIRSIASAISFSTTVAGASGAPEYGLWISAERMV